MLGLPPRRREFHATFLHWVLLLNGPSKPRSRQIRIHGPGALKFVPYSRANLAGSSRAAAVLLFFFVFVFFFFVFGLASSSGAPVPCFSRCLGASLGGSLTRMARPVISAMLVVGLGGIRQYEVEEV